MVGFSKTNGWQLGPRFRHMDHGRSRSRNRVQDSAVAILFLPDSRQLHLWTIRQSAPEDISELSRGRFQQPDRFAGHHGIQRLQREETFYDRHTEALLGDISGRR